MISLFDLLKYKFPDINILPFGGDVNLGDHGDGKSVILNWTYTKAPQPTQDDLDEWMADNKIQAQHQLSQNKILNAPIYEQLDIIDAKSIRALRTNDTSRLAALEQQAVELRFQLK